MENNISKLQSDKLSPKDIEDLRNAYQSLPQMIAYEGQKSWNALSVFIQLAFVLAAGAIVPSFLPESSSEIVLALVGIILSLTGIAASIIWIYFDKRYRKITRYWILSVRGLEDKLSGTLDAFRKGKLFSEGEEVIVSGESIGYGHFEKLPERTGFLLIYIAFGIVFLGLLGLNVSRLIVAL